MTRTSISATIWLALSAAAIADDTPENLDVDEALARQSASDLISGVAVAYECRMTQQSIRKLGTDHQRVYLVEVAMAGPECQDALLLLARHGSRRDFIFRAWEPAPDVERVDPIEMESGASE